MRIKNFLFISIIRDLLHAYFVKYLSPINLNYLWNLGSLAGFFLVFQIITGFFLTMFYTPHIFYAFQSVEHIMRDIAYGWFIRYLHSNGASFFFLIVYIHIGRGLYYSSYQYPRNLLWFSGVLIYFLMMATGFLGYVLPWGQMSYRAATVITNSLTVIPLVGKLIVYWVWGGFAINNATLNRFFTLHYILPFIISLIVLYHLYILHQTSSNNSLGLKTIKIDKINFYPFYTSKDLFGLVFFLLSYLLFVFFFPESLSHSDNYIPANPLVTPSHIVPEWYFLPFYGILRSISDKTYGIIIMFLSIFCILFLPYLDKCHIKSNKFKPINNLFYWLFIVNFIFLGYLGSQTPTNINILVGLLCTHYHLLYIFFIIPIINLFYKNYIILKHKKRYRVKYKRLKWIYFSGSAYNRSVYNR
jgi:ubiquinol-cytochrome c reductase cytochrome b/c1 subunit